MVLPVPWVNRLSEELQYPTIAEVVSSLSLLSQPRAVVSVDTVLYNLRNGTISSIPAEAELVQRLRRCLHTHRFRTPTSADPSTAIHTQTASPPASHHASATPPDAFILTLLEDVLVAYANTRSREGVLESLADDVHPTADYYMIESLNHVLRWNIWRLHNHVVLGILPADVCTINELPAEILSTVFEYVCQFPARDFHEAKVTYLRHSWDVSSHLILRLVCKRWLQLVKDDPVVWPPMVQGFGEEWTQRALEWSGQLDVSIRIGRQHLHWTVQDGLNLSDTAHALLRHASRFRSLSVALDSSDELALVTHAVAQTTMKRLQDLSVSTSDGSSLPERLFKEIAPMLATVTLFNVQISARCCIFRSPLTHLVVSQCKGWWSLDSMLSTLQQLPGLQHLEWSASQNIWRNDVVQFQTVAVSVMTPLPLRCLKFLSLECPLSWSEAIVSSISLPDFCHIHALDDTSLVGEESHDCLAIVDIVHHLDNSLGRYLSTIYPTGSGQGFRTVSLASHSQDMPSTIVIHATTGEYIPGVPVLKAQPATCTFSVTLTLPDVILGADEDDTIAISPKVLQHFLRHIMAWPSLSLTIETFATSHPALADPAIWLSVLTPLSHLSHIHVEDALCIENFAAVPGLSSALSEHLDLVPTLTDVLIGPLDVLSIEHRRAIVTAIWRRRQFAARPVISLALVDAEEFITAEEVEHFATEFEASGCGTVTVWGTDE